MSLSHPAPPLHLFLSFQVVYLSLSDWLEKRNLDKLVAEEQELARKQQAKAEAGQKKVPVVRATPKGFGRRSSKEEEEEAEK